MRNTHLLARGGEVPCRMWPLIRKISFVLTILIHLYTSYSHAQRFHLLKLNRMKHGLRQGLWVTYADSSHTTLEWQGRFRKGDEKGVWKYYYSNGKIRRKEKYRFHKIKTSNYFESGALQSNGYARMDAEEDKLHYYYQGPWSYYSEDGKVTKIIYYEKGVSVKEQDVK